MVTVCGKFLFQVAILLNIIFLEDGFDVLCWDVMVVVSEASHSSDYESEDSYSSRSASDDDLNLSDSCSDVSKEFSSDSK